LQALPVLPALQALPVALVVQVLPDLKVLQDLRVRKVIQGRRGKSGLRESRGLRVRPVPGEKRVFRARKETRADRLAPRALLGQEVRRGKRVEQVLPDLKV
jgi:hypothetical protein